VEPPWGAWLSLVLPIESAESSSERLICQPGGTADRAFRFSKGFAIAGAHKNQLQGILAQSFAAYHAKTACYHFSRKISRSGATVVGYKHSIA
jgi:hypothetical protein